MVVKSLWGRTLASAIALYAATTFAAILTGNPRLVPSVILVGALLVPVTFVVYAFERLRVTADIVPTIFACFLAGGLLGTAAASLLEYETLRSLGFLPMLAVGVIEEGAKMAFPLVLFTRRRFRTQPEGLLIGVAAAMGFASFESMGYGLTALIQSGGHLGFTEEVLAIRGLLAPVGHAAWTALIALTVWQVRDRRLARGRAAVSVAAAFMAAASLHALWDSTDSLLARGMIIAVSGYLLASKLRSGRARPASVHAA